MSTSGIANRISPNPVWQLVDEGGDIIASLNNTGATPTVAGNPPVAGPVSKVKVLLTAAQLNAIKTTPINLVPAPGPNRYLQVLGITARYLFGTTAFTLNAGTLKLFMGAVASAKALTADMSALLTQVVNATTIGQAVLGLATLTDAQAINVSIQIGNDGAANYTLGDGTVEFIVIFEVVSVP
jgi:hypothetical protein